MLISVAACGQKAESSITESVSAVEIASTVAEAPATETAASEGRAKGISATIKS